MPGLLPRIATAVIVLAACPARVAHAQNDVPWLAAVDLDTAGFDAQMSANAAQGYRPVSINGRNTAAGARFEVVWHHDAVTDSQFARGLTRTQAQTWVSDRAAEGYSTTLVSAYIGGATEIYAVAAARDGGVRVVSWNLTSGGLNTDINTRVGQGYWPVWITTWVNSGNLRHGIVYKRMNSGGWALWVGQSPAVFQGNNTNYHTQGLRVMGLTSDGAPSNSGLSGVWEYIPQPEGGYAELFDQTRAQFDATVAQMTAQGMRPTIVAGQSTAGGTRYHSAWVSQTELFPRAWSVEGREVPGLAPLDSAMQEYMTANRVSAAQLAVTYQGRLVLNRAYTWGRDGFPAVSLGDRFRTASVCKPQVATAVMQLVEQGLLSLDARMVDYIGGMWSDARAASITIRDLLRHSGGWDRNISPDPMFQDAAIAASLGVPLPITREHIIQYQRTRPLNHNPGTGTYYSNFGYMLLGKIIEQVTGVPYEQYCREHLWDNVVTRDGPRVGSHLAQPGEVEYVDVTGGLYSSVYGAGPLVPWAYGGFNMENLVSVGAWTASARDLCRFTRAIEDVSRTGLISQVSLNTMLAKPPYADPNPQANYYALGWVVLPGYGVAAWHDGALLGTGAEIGVLNNGVTYSVVTNVNPYYVGADGFMLGFLGPLLHGVADWPGGDQWCTADFNADGFVDFFDVDEYVGCFETGDCPPGATADFNEDGFVDFFDIDAFLAAFEAGC